MVPRQTRSECGRKRQDDNNDFGEVIRCRGSRRLLAASSTATDTCWTAAATCSLLATVVPLPARRPCRTPACVSWRHSTMRSAYSDSAVFLLTVLSDLGSSIVGDRNRAEVVSRDQLDQMLATFRQHRPTGPRNLRIQSSWEHGRCRLWVSEAPSPVLTRCDTAVVYNGSGTNVCNWNAKRATYTNTVQPVKIHRNLQIWLSVYFQIIFLGWICLGDNLIYAFSDICKNMFCKHDGQRLMCL